MLRFTSEFEMGSGGTTALWTPSKLAEYGWSFVGLGVNAVLALTDGGLHHSILEKLSGLPMTFTEVKALDCNLCVNRSSRPFWVIGSSLTGN